MVFGFPVGHSFHRAGLTLDAVPCNLEAERQCLAAMIMDNSVIPDVESIVSWEDFFRSDHQKVFRCIISAYGSVGSVDIPILSDEIKASGFGKQSADYRFLAELIGSAPHSANAKYHAQIVYGHAAKRKMIEIANDTLKRCYSNNETAISILESMEKGLNSVLSGSSSSSQTASISDVCSAVTSSMKTRNGTISGIPTGIDDLDCIIDGLCDSQMVVVAGRPSMGKSAFAHNVIAESACKGGIPSLLFSIEMSAFEVARRMIISMSGVNEYSMRNYSMMTSEQKKKVEAASSIISSSPIFINDSGSLNPTQFARVARHHKRNHGIRLIVLDYIQIMAPDDNFRGNRQEQVAGFCRAIRAISRELNVPVIALSQISRQSEASADKRPMLSNLRESGAIENDAHAVILLHRPEYYSDGDKPGVAELIVAKNRNGETKTIDCSWNGSLFKFGNLLPSVSAFGAAPATNGKASSRQANSAYLGVVGSDDEYEDNSPWA